MRDLSSTARAFRLIPRRSRCNRVNVSILTLWLRIPLVPLCMAFDWLGLVVCVPVCVQAKIDQEKEKEAARPGAKPYAE